MHVVSFNLRYDTPNDGQHQFKYRKELILRTILQKAPDIIAFQEVLPHVVLWLKEHLVDYYILGSGREVDLSGEQTCVAYRKDRFNLIKMEIFWLSPTPEIPASRFPGQSECCPRTCTLLYLQELESKKIFRLYNVHLEHNVENVRLESIALIKSRIKLDNYLGNHPAILLGDFNTTPDSIEVELLTSDNFLVDATANLGITYHEFHTLGNPIKIDYIFIDPNLIFTKPERWIEQGDGTSLSDHYPVSVHIDLNY